MSLFVLSLFSIHKSLANKGMMETGFCRRVYKLMPTEAWLQVFLFFICRCEQTLLSLSLSLSLIVYVSPCSARKSLSPVLDSNGSLVVKRRSAEELEKELRGGDAMREHGLHLSEGQ